MTELQLIRGSAEPAIAGLRPEVQALVRAYDLDSDWLRGVLAGRDASSLSVSEIRTSLGVGDRPVSA